MEYYCPKCKSIDVTDTCIDFKEPERMSMDDSNVFGCTHAVLVINKWELKCGKCGYAVEYSK